METEDCVDFAQEAREARMGMRLGGCLPVAVLAAAVLWLAWCSLWGMRAVFSLAESVGYPECVCERCGRVIGEEDAGRACAREGEDEHAGR